MGALDPPRILLITNEEKDIAADLVVNSYEEGRRVLLDEGPWDVLYIDYQLEDSFIPPRTGLTILQDLKEFPENIPRKIELVSTDPWHNSMMRKEIDKLMEIKQGK